MPIQENNLAVRLENVSRSYKLYKHPKDRLREALNPLGKKYHSEFFALKNISLDVRKGEILGIVGRNGAGKSTLLRIISGILPPTSGRVDTRGALSTFLDLGAGFNPDFTGIQNLFFSGIMMGFARTEMEKKIDDILAFADIGQFIHQPLKTYSKGMVARLGFSLAININPQILVLDEVLAVGDELFRRRCYAKLEEFFHKGCTVLYVSHSVPSVNQLCTRALFIDSGELVLEGPPFLVTSHYQKLIFSPEDQKQRVRDEIIELNKDEEAKKRFIRESENKTKNKTNNKTKNKGTEEQTKPAAKENTAAANPKPKAGPYPYLLQGFKSKSTVVARPFPVDISDTHIRTLDGKKVNALVLDETYIYSYKVTFHDNFNHVFFTMAIKDEKGMNLSSSETREEPTAYLLERVKKGETRQVDWTFKCALMPRDYYTNTGVYRMDDQKKSIMLNRTTDAMVFRVQRSEGHSYKGFVHLSQQYDVKPVSLANKEPAPLPAQKQKLAVIAYPLGRIGSSAAMGLLKSADVTVGEKERLNPAGKINPKGFFELLSQQQLLEKTFAGFYPDISNTPSMDRVDTIAREHFAQYHELIQSEFGNRSPIAVKSQRCLTLSFLAHLRDRYDIRVVVMTRNEKDQVESTLRVWKQSPDQWKQNITYDRFRSILQKWKDFSNELLNHYQFQYYTLSFDRLIAEPVEAAKELAQYLDIEPPSADNINRWIDATLVNRKEL